jgi:hypothetical protein
MESVNSHHGPSAEEPQPKRYFTAETPVMRKNSKIRQNRKICLNEITYLQLLIFGKRDFFSRPPSSQSSEYFLIKNFYSLRSPRLSGEFSSGSIEAE